MSRLLVTGCGRSGTRWLAWTLAEAGVPATHEGGGHDPRRGLVLSSPVDVSWPAGWWAADFPGLIAHQIRHPLDVAASTEKRRTFAKPRPYGKWAMSKVPAIAAEPDPIRKALRYWHDWNRMLQPHADICWQVETLDADTLTDVLARAGVPVDPSALRTVLAADAVDRHDSEHPPLTWDDLPEGPVKRDVARLAKEVGYL